MTPQAATVSSGSRVFVATVTCRPKCPRFGRVVERARYAVGDGRASCRRPVCITDGSSPGPQGSVNASTRPGARSIDRRRIEIGSPGSERRAAKLSAPRREKTPTWRPSDADASSSSVGIRR